MNVSCIVRNGRAIEYVCIERDAMQKIVGAIKRAAGIIADVCGECPVSRYEWLPFDDKCEGACADDMDQCWVEYLTGVRWSEQEGEADE